MFFWNARDLTRKLGEFRDYYNAHRVRRALAGSTPAQRAGASSAAPTALDQYARQQHCLLIMDELGDPPLEANAAHLFFQLVSRRYGRGPMLVTSNGAVSEWGSVFGDSVVATAILDRGCSITATSLRSEATVIGYERSGD